MSKFEIPSEEHLRELIARKPRALRTQKTLVSNLLRLKEGGFDLTDVESTIKTLSDRFKPSTVQGYVNSIVCMLNEFQDQEQLCNIYKERNVKLQKKIEADVKKQPLTEGQQQAWQSWDTVLAKRDEIGEAVKKVAKKKRDGEQLKEADKVTVYRHLLLCLYTYIPPQRAEFAACLLLDKPMETYPKTDNYYVMDNNRDQLVLARHKTAKYHGTRHLNVPDQLKRVVRESLELMPRKWLLSQVNNPQLPWSQPTVSKQLAGTLGKGAGCSLLRKIAKTTWRERNEGNDDKLANLMGHTLATAERTYNTNRKLLSNNSMFTL